MDPFSRRLGIIPPKPVQTDSIDDDLKNSLWNALDIFYLSSMGNSHYRLYEMDPETQSFCDELWVYFFRLSLDTIPDDAKLSIKKIRDFFFNCEWYGVYELLDFITDNISLQAGPQKFMDYCNRVLQKENSAYRFVSGVIDPITSESEIAEIEHAIIEASKMAPVQNHLRRSLELLADRQSPDYRNSIKGSIGAVESFCSILAGSSKAELREALESA